VAILALALPATSVVSAVLPAGSRPASASSPTASSAAIPDQRTAVGDHACIVAGSGHPVVDWGRLRNPILSEPAAGVKDEAIVWTGGRWHMLFSDVTDRASRPGGVSWDIATATSPDLAHWSAPSLWPSQPGVVGVASPDIVRDPTGGFIVTYQSDPGASAPSTARSRLYYRTSRDLVHWSAPHALAQTLAPAPDDRMIDGALVFTGRQLLLGFKFSSSDQSDVFEMARSTSGRPEGPWQLVGRPDIEVEGGTIENYEFLTLGGTWHLMATSDNLDQPWLFTLAGDPAVPAGWLDWTGARQLMVPGQGFDSGPGISSLGYEHANSAFLCDAGALPGHFAYLFYAGSEELTQFGGWGHARIGVARSTDLIHWQVPPG
jgi:hypothetical protein